MSNRNLILAAAGGAPSGPTDPNFNQTVLLLHGDGTNGAQNNTFLDSSTNNFTVTRNGNTTQGTFSPFSSEAGKWSNYFDGTGDYLSIASNADFAYGTGDFTWEAWVYRTTTTDDSLYTTMVNDGFIVHIISGNVIVRQFGVADLITSSATVSANTWTHIAVARSGTTLSLWINGSRSSGGTTTNSTNFTQNGVRIGINDIDTNLLVGYLSNLRSVKGTAVYDPTSTTITIPTTPLTAVSGTELLTCQSNRFKDNSSNAFAITVAGNTSVQPFSPFAPSAAYDASVNGGSGYFDGSGDYLSVAHNTDLNLSGGDFTISCWVYTSSVATTQTLVNKDGIYGTNQPQYDLEIQSGYLFGRVGNSGGAVGVAYLFASTPFPVNQWTYCEFGRSGSTLYLFQNGVLENTAADTAMVDSGRPLYIGTEASSSLLANGYVTDVRIIKGTCLHTTNYTAPTSPVTAVSGTELLCNFTNAGIFDNTGKNNLETVGNAQIDTTTKKYGTGSMEFDGSGDYLVVPASQLNSFGTSEDFTIELWFYSTNNPASGNQYLFDMGTNGTRIQLFNQVLYFYMTNSQFVQQAYTGSNEWVHLAITRSGSTGYAFVNGSLVSSTTANLAAGTTSAWRIAEYGGGGQPLEGLVDDLRITKGVARYTSAFTPPTAALPDL